eukprot:g25702.t1
MCPGTDGGNILLAADGLVFDVSSARNLYGPGGKYAPLAGRDASRLLGKNSLEEESDASREMPLNLAEKAFLSAWVMSFKSKYPIVGKLVEEEKQAWELSKCLNALHVPCILRSNGKSN